MPKPWKKPLRLRTFFTTGEVARWLDLDPSTIVKRINTGRLEGFRPDTPASHRYIPRDVVVRLLSQRGITVPGVWPEGTPILIVDDDPRVAPIVEHTFAAAGVPLQVLSAASVPEALEILSRKPRPAAIVLDWRFHGQKMQGKDALRVIRESDATRDIPILLMTAYAGHDAERAAAKYGLPHPLGKPMSLEALKDQLWPMVFGRDPRGDKGPRRPMREMIPAKRESTR